FSCLRGSAPIHPSLSLHGIAIQKRLAQHDRLDQGAGPVIAALESICAIFQNALIEFIEFAAECISKHFTREIGQELIFVLEQDGFELARSAELLPIGKYAGRINRFVAQPRSPPADRVKILETEADGVHSGMAGSALEIGPMLFEQLAEADAIGSAIILRKLGNRWRRRWDALAEQLFQNPFPSQHGAGAK